MDKSNNNGAKDSYKTARQNDNPNRSADDPSKRCKIVMDNKNLMKDATSQDQNAMNSNNKK